MEKPREELIEELQSLRQQAAELRETIADLTEKLQGMQDHESKLRQILDLVPAFIFAVDWDGRIILANKALAEAYGTTVNELIGRLATDVAPDLEQARRLLADHRQVMETGRPSFTPQELVVDVHGNEHILQIHRIPYTDAETDKRAVMGVAIDITDRMKDEQRVLRSRDAVIFGLAKLAESRDDDTGQHLERICRLVEILASQVAKTNPDLDEEWVRTISTTAAMHDIGKVGVPDAVLLKPGALTEDERRTIQRHTYIGGDTLLEIKRRWGEDPFLVTAAQIAMGHHEKWDGNGYPFGLTGDDIPLAARVVAVADVYDALTSKRVYKNRMPHDQARQIIIDEAGTHFDPQVVHAFMACEAQFRAVAAQMNPDGGS